MNRNLIKGCWNRWHKNAKSEPAKAAEPEGKQDNMTSSKPIFDSPSSEPRWANYHAPYFDITKP